MKSRLSRKLKAMTIAGMLTIALTGCQNALPEMTTEEVAQIGEYAAITLLKYDANARSRLVDEETVLAYEQKQQALKELAAKETPKEESAGMEPVADTPVIEKEKTDVVQNTVSSLETSLSVPEGITITYTGYEVCDTYPEDGLSKEYLSLDATAGKKLLVLEFTAQNSSAAEVSANFFSTKAGFSVDLGDGTKQKAMISMLMNDMSTYIGTIPAGESQNLVLLFEIDESKASNLEGVQLYYKDENGTNSIQL